MDEILIEEKRYISSKQAAKITGYAKDYIGQLCREGRVTARLVGRSWYVLEAAIQDHRFGAPAVEPMSKDTPKEAEPVLSSSLSEPRYSEVVEEKIPTVDELSETPSAHIQESADATASTDPLQDSWRSWFDRAEDSAVEAITPHAEPVEAAEERIEQEESVEENVPVRAIHHTLYKPDEEVALPAITKVYRSQEAIYEEQPIRRTNRKGRNQMVSGIQAGSLLVGALAIALALIGSGFFDAYVLSNRQVSLMAGVAVYDKAIQ